MRNVGKYVLTKEDVREAILHEVVSKGVQVDPDDSLDINPDGTVDINYDKDFSLQAPVPAPTLPPGYVVVGEATIFGLNYDGSVDKGDDGVGAWGAKTANQEIVGVSLPEEVLMDTFGVPRPWGVRAATAVGLALKEKAAQVSVTRNGKTVVADIVDAGPAASTHNAIDLTYNIAHQLETNGKAIVSYSILVGDKPIPIKGWDSVKGQVTT